MQPRGCRLRTCVSMSGHKGGQFTRVTPNNYATGSKAGRSTRCLLLSISVLLLLIPPFLAPFVKWASANAMAAITQWIDMLLPIMCRCWVAGTLVQETLDRRSSPNPIRVASSFAVSTRPHRNIHILPVHAMVGTRPSRRTPPRPMD